MRWMDFWRGCLIVLDAVAVTHSDLEGSCLFVLSVSQKFCTKAKACLGWKEIKLFLPSFRGFEHFMTMSILMEA